MDIAALITWLVTALGGFLMLGVWISRGGLRGREDTRTRFPAPVIFGHLLLAAAGLVLWIVFLAIDSAALAWAALIILVPVALLGFVMLARWIPVYRAAGAEGAPPERNIPVAVVVGHGLLAVVTLVLVLLTVLGMG